MVSCTVGLVGFDTPLKELMGMVAVQSVSAKFGAMLSRKQLSTGGSQKIEDHAPLAEGYGGHLFPMLAETLFVALQRHAHP